jgi:peptide deformylase
MIETMKEHKGLGLAANQIGIPYSVFVMEGMIPLAMFNPSYVPVGDETETIEEGCLSYPGLMVKVKRHKIVDVTYQDTNGESKTLRLNGLSARVVQHEMEHLEGKVFYNSANKFHRDQGLRKWKRKV